MIKLIFGVKLPYFIILIEGLTESRSFWTCKMTPVAKVRDHPRHHAVGQEGGHPQNASLGPPGPPV